MNLILFTCIVQILMWFVISYTIYKKNNDLFNTGVIISSLFIIYFPLKILGSYYGFSYIQNPFEYLSVDFIIFSMLLANVSVFLIIFPFLFCRRFKIKADRSAFVIKKNIKYPTIIFFLILFFIIKVTIFGFDRIYAITNIDLLLETPEIFSNERAGGGWRAILHHVAFVILFFHFYLVFLNWASWNKIYKFFYVILFLSMLYPLLVITYSKHEMIYPLFLCLIVIHCLKLLNGSKSLSYIHGVLLALGFFGLIIIAGMLRYGIYVGTFLEWLFIPFDSADNFTFILSRIDNMFWGDMFLLPTIENLFISPIPRQLWPDKPFVNGFLRIQEIYLPYHFSGYTGETVSTTLMGEFMVSGGILFLIIGSIMTGLILYYFYDLYFTSNRLSMTCIHAFIILNIYELYRGGTRIFPMFMIGLFVFLLLIPLLNKIFIDGNNSQNVAK